MTKLAANWVSTCAEFPVSNIHTGLSFPFLLCWPPVLTRIEFSCEKYFMAQSLVVDSELKCICICVIVFEKSVVGSAPCCGRWAGIPQTFAGTLLRWHPKFTFSTFTPDPNLQNPHLHKTQIYTNSNLHSSDLHTPKFTQPHIGIPKFTQLKFTPNWTQIYTALNLQRHRFTMCQTTGPQGHCLFWTN